MSGFLTIQCDDSVVAKRIEVTYDQSIEDIKKITGCEMSTIFKIVCPSDKEYSYTSYSYNEFCGAIFRIKIHLTKDWTVWQLWHELGHVYMIQEYDYKIQNLPYIQDQELWDRDLWKPTTPELAFWEGWASYVQLLLSSGKVKAQNNLVAGDVAYWFYQADPEWLWDYVDRKHPKSVDAMIEDVFRPIVIITFGTVKNPLNP
jgi:hypothetical protein